MEKDKEPLLREYLNKIKQIHPIVHCITNTITVNDCANMVLALGASPTMAHHTLEVEEITAGTNALVCNLGATECLEAMELAGEKAAALGHPIVLDPGSSRINFQAKQMYGIDGACAPNLYSG